MLGAFNADRHQEAFTLIEQGQISQAIALYRIMLSIVPDDEKTHHNLATFLKQQGDLDAAVTHYREALRLKPDYTFAHYNLAEIAGHQGRLKEALDHYRQALQLMPELLPALNNLARLLATHPDPVYRDVPEAIRLAEKACQLSNDSEAFLLDTLATAYAAAGRYTEAEATAQKALSIALTDNNSRLVKKIRRQIKQYEGQFSTEK